MQFKPEQYKIKDERMKPFIDSEEILNYLKDTKATKERVREVIAKSLAKNRLTLEETAILLNADDPELIEEIKQGAKDLKEKVYGNRIVLFAPLYVGNKCMNNCTYCGFKASNKEAIRKTLNDNELREEVEALEDNGQKRLILVYGEHTDYSPEFIAQSVETVYKVKKGNGEIRRVNINAAPLDIEGFKIVKGFSGDISPRRI
jgi:2-iminoacetate synthase